MRRQAGAAALYPLPMDVITSTESLEAACSRLAQSDYIAVDTEFMRESTFWPKLCLVQMAGDGCEVILDTLAQDIDLKAFYSLMADKSVVKVFHAARQDVEIIHHQAGIIPDPIFDTQIAAMVCGFGESVSYSMLVKKMLKINLDKTSRFTDWSKRPLADRQLTYALADVTHLFALFPKLREQLRSSGRADWLAEELNVLTDPATYDIAPEDAWKRLKMRVKSAKSLGVMMELAAWREREARDQNVPRSRVLKDDAIYDIAAHAPRSVHDLGGLRSIHGGFARSARGQAVLDAVGVGLDRDPSTIPPIKRSDPLSAEAVAVVDLLRVLLKTSAARHGVAPKLIATAQDLEKIARSDDADVPALKGWRRTLFGNDALAIKRGELALAVRKGSIAILSAEDMEPISRKANKGRGDTGAEQDTASERSPA